MIQHHLESEGYPMKVTEKEVLELNKGSFPLSKAFVKFWLNHDTFIKAIVVTHPLSVNVY